MTIAVHLGRKATKQKKQSKNTVKPVLREATQKGDQKLFFKIDYLLMRVKSILQYF